MSQSTELVPIGERFVEKESCHLCNGEGEIALESKSKCSDCNGIGWRLNSESSPEVCATCAGHQKLITTKRLKCKKCDGRGFCVNLIQRFQSKKKCSTCSGTGHLNCKACNGTGVYRGLSRNSMGVVLTCTYCHLWKNRYAIKPIELSFNQWLSTSASKMATRLHGPDYLSKLKRGASIDLGFKRSVSLALCPTCKGNPASTCRICKGNQIHKVQIFDFGTCKICNGRGRYSWTPECLHCEGSKVYKCDDCDGVGKVILTINQIVPKSAAAIPIVKVKESSGKLTKRKNKFPQIMPYDSRIDSVEIRPPKLDMRSKTPLTEMGYHVGKSGIQSASERREILCRIIDSSIEKLPKTGPASYMRQWGQANSMLRVRHVAYHLSWNIGFQGAKEENRLAKRHWIADLRWITSNLKGVTPDSKWPHVPS